ncbi:MAG: hypothetical protein KJO28_10955, partial [Desulfofustis sp.]|nr:hypothetical protein [Desulfofustis sp.]
MLTVSLHQSGPEQDPGAVKRPVKKDGRVMVCRRHRQSTYSVVPITPWTNQVMPSRSPSLMAAP